MQAIIYLRKSTDDNRHQKASIEDQRAWALSYVEELRAKGSDVDVVRIFEEKRTAKEPGRPLFGEMMGEIYAGRADVVITWDIDRLSRNEVDEGTIKWAIRQGKIKQVHTHNSVYTEHELLTMSIFLSLGAEEIAKMRQRVMRRMNSMVAEGKVPYRAPYGYRNSGEGEVEIHESESVVVRRIFALRKKGLSIGQIAEDLNASGIPIRGRGRDSDGTKWNETRIDFILKNDFYVGVVRFAGQVGKGIHESLVSRDIFDEVNSDGRTLVGYRFHEFPLKGIVTDPDGKPLKASLIKKKFVYYHNDRHKTSISQKKIFEMCAPLAEKWLVPKHLVPLAKEEIRKLVTSENKAVFAELAEVRRLMAENDRKLSNLVDAYVAAKISEPEYDSRRKECESTRAKLIRDEEALAVLEGSLAEKFETLVKLLEILSQTYARLSDSEKGLLLKNALVKLEIDSEKRLQIQQKEVFEHLFTLNNFEWQPRWEPGETSPLLRFVLALNRFDVDRFRKDLEPILKKA